MWSYYGRKKQIIKKYPKPVYKTIIEPFAGTASYSYEYWENDIILYDKYDVLCRIWWYLQQASPEDILSLPVPENKTKLELVDGWSSLADEEKWLIGFCTHGGVPTPSKSSSSMNFNYWWRDRIRIAKDLYKIKHWKIILGDYKEQENISATWYIDPPYQFGGHLYKFSNKEIDYPALGEWSKGRKGQVIVCEKSDATWMEFSPLCETNGQKHNKSTEVMWYKED